MVTGRSTTSLLIAGMLLPAVAMASSTGQLPAFVCAHPDAIYAHGFETQAARYVEPSNGSGGAIAGNQTRTVTVAGMGVRNYYLYVPTSYSPSRPMPVMLALHGAGGPGTADAGAQAARNAWSAKAESGRFIVIAAVASGSQGGWIPPPAPSDYDTMRAMLADVKAAYNVDGSRIHAWGFSAGGHVLHDMVLGSQSAGLNIDTFAGYGVSAGVLAAFACSNPPGGACTSLLAGQPRRIPLDIHVGNSDSLLSFAQDDYNRFQATGWTANGTVWLTTFTGAHTYTAANLSEIWDHLCPFQRLP